ncbi:hypothetical protein AB0C76_14710 [Kitasatospora sp. NPDC048722]|uniref:hypothetical protein n=1 Tax=Kitasatospora sp. NPDC048722 TaxID=3155639 RepID=UPI0033E9F4FF
MISRLFRISKRTVALATAAMALAGVSGISTAGSASADVNSEWNCSRNPGGWDHMNWGNCLLPGDSLVSPGGFYRLTYQHDGNLVEYKKGERSGWTAIWQSGTQNTAPGKAIMQYDGNFVVYDTFKNALWATGTNNGCNPAANWLRIQNDANLVVYRPHGDGAWTPVWSSQNGRVGTLPGSAVVAFPGLTVATA